MGLPFILNRKQIDFCKLLIVSRLISHPHWLMQGEVIQLVMIAPKVANKNGGKAIFSLLDDHQRIRGT